MENESSKNESIKYRDAQSYLTNGKLDFFLEEQLIETSVASSGWNYNEKTEKRQRAADKFEPYIEGGLIIAPIIAIVVGVVSVFLAIFMPPAFVVDIITPLKENNVAWFFAMLLYLIIVVLIGGGGFLCLYLAIWGIEAFVVFMSEVLLNKKLIKWVNDNSDFTFKNYRKTREDAKNIFHLYPTYTADDGFYDAAAKFLKSITLETSEQEQMASLAQERVAAAVTNSDISGQIVARFVSKCLKTFEIEELKKVFYEKESNA